ncbi:hypothetical protein [Longicatena caecimuris]|uniref:hypothetical protein n=1 Tax=Longicatena caecimuris TaxID=1796635 RepID=UPI0022E245C5|nr:hypothetical protein [Longicatena caecimuris]
MAGGERHPTAETGLSHIPAKSDKRKTAKAVIPLRFRESLFLLCRDLASTFEVQSPFAVARIFLTGYPPILDMVYVSRSCCLQAIKIPPNSKRVWRDELSAFYSGVAIQPTKNLVFFIWWALVQPFTFKILRSIFEDFIKICKKKERCFPSPIKS